MKRLIYGGLCLIFLVLISFSQTTAQDNGDKNESDIPYIYYFSADLNAIVVERADGTDTRILGNGLLETESNFEQYHIYRVEEAEWSPSGKWLVWKVMYQERHLSGNYKKRLFVMSADGQRVLPIVHDYQETDFSWSPTEDILAIYGTVGQVDELLVNPEAVVIAMYDFARNEIIFSQQISGDGIRIDMVGYGRYPILAHWMPDGQHVVFETQNVYDDTMYYWSINRDGSFHSFHQFANTIPVETDYDNPSSFANGWVVYTQPSSIPYSLIGCTVIFDNIVTGEQHIVELLDKDCPFMEQIIWNAEQEQAIFLGEGVWLWTTANWVSFSDIPPYRRLPNPYRISLLASNWSPSGKYVLLDGQNGIFQIDTSTQEMTMLISFEEDDVPYYEFWVWLNESEVFVSGFYDNNVSIDYHFDFSSGIAEAHYHPIQASYVRYSPFILTNDGVEIYIADGAVIYNRGENSYHYVQPAAPSYGSAEGGSVSLSADEQWVLVNEQGTLANIYLNYWGVMRIDGSLRRDLTGPYHFANWLPPQVNINELPPSLTESLYPIPQKVLYGENWINSIFWSPDGNFLLVDYRPAKDESGIAILRNIATGDSTFISTIDYVFHSKVDWEQNNDGIYTPIIGDVEAVGEWRGWEIGAISPDNSVYVVTENGHIYDMATHEIISEVACSHGIYIFDYALNPDGSMLARPSGIWDVQTGKKLSDMPVTGRAFEFSPDGTQLAIGVSWDILIYDVDELLAWELPE